MNTGPVVTFGEMLLRLSPPHPEPLFQSNALRTWWGGAESNVAAGLAQLGTPSRHVSVLPHNAVGDAAAAALAAHGVDTSAVVRRDGRMGLYFLDPGAGDRPLRVTYDRAHSAFASLEPSAFDWPALLRDARWLHLTGITPALGDGPLQCVHDALTAAAAWHVPVSLDLNFRPALWAGRDPRPVMQPIAARAQLLIANPGAIATMLGITTAGSAPEPVDALLETARRVHAQCGCARIAITQREVFSPQEHGWQAHLWDAAGDVLHSGGRYRLPVLDRVGGGDAFAAALLHMLLQDAAPSGAILFATAAGAHKLGIPGDVLRASVDDVHRFLATPA